LHIRRENRLNNINDFLEVEDCIHLHACRRIAKFSKYRNRGCNSRCSAYQSFLDFKEENNLYDKEQVTKVMLGACYDGTRGYTDNMIEDYI
jgi:hypothetical protein